MASSTTINVARGWVTYLCYFPLCGYFQFMIQYRLHHNKAIGEKHQKRGNCSWWWISCKVKSEFKTSRDFITLTPQILSDNYMSCCFRNLWLVSWSLPVKAAQCHFVVPREGAQFKSPLLMSVFASGPHSWKAESRLPLLRGSVCHKGAPAEAQALEPPRQGQCGAQGRAV